MRRQNLDLLRIATQVAGYSGTHGPLKPGDLKNAMRTIWDLFSEFYAWVDPEEAEETMTRMTTTMASDWHLVGRGQSGEATQSMHRCSKSNESDDQFQTVHWVGDAATGFLRLIDQTLLPNRICGDRLPRRAGGLGGDQVAAGPRCARDRRRGGLRGGDRGANRGA